jgi:para-nitrobenzyl esterase
MREILTTSGPVRGRSTAYGTAFLGVPYAAGPVGAARFAAPEPPEPWTEVRAATAPGPTAPQPARDAFGTLDMSPYFGPGWQRGTDYLTVNIWAPPARAEPVPVLVFVHGGGFVAGSVNSPLYDGTAFARDGVVLVTVNYRLGVPGFLHLPDAPDNRGLLDVEAALRWVRDNIARFGGDPGNVTLFGQSAGAILVGGVLADPAAAGLLRRAIVQSGSGLGAFTREQARIVTAAVGRELGVRPSVATLAGISDERFAELMPRLSGLDLRTPGHHDPLGGITAFSLVLDDQPADAAADGQGGDVDLLIGANLDEGALYLAPLGLLDGTTDADVYATAARFHPDPTETVRAYRAARPGASAAELRTAVLGDGLFGTGTRALTEAHADHGPTWAYRFTWRSGALDGRLGASHVMELPFVFDQLHLPALHGPRALLGEDEAPRELAVRMHGAWIRFATTGDPGWPAYPLIHQLGSP